MPGGTARGVDQLGPADLALHPASARQELAELLLEAEAQGTWPWQVLFTLVVLLYKSPTSDRAISLLASTGAT